MDVMSNDDDIEKLLREVDGLTSAQPPSARADSPAPSQKPPTSRSGGIDLAIAAVIGVAGLLLGFLPLVPDFWLGLGGFLGAYVALFIKGRLG